tara:strand:- start:123 stop:830 length:708 start_codon:yes stop_codon:yes gene_type:complete
MAITLKKLIEAQAVEGLDNEDVKSLSYDVKPEKSGIMKIIEDYGIDPARTALGIGISAAMGVPFIGQALTGIGTMFQQNPSDQFSSGFNVGNVGDIYGYRAQGLGSPGIAQQDPFGINTVSMFGNYPAYADKTVRNLLAKDTLTPFQKNQLDFYQDVVDKNNQRIDSDFPGGTNFNFQDYEQDTGGSVPTGGGSSYSVPDRPDKSGATGSSAGGFTNPGKGSYGPHFAIGGIVSL